MLGKYNLPLTALCQVKCMTTNALSGVDVEAFYKINGAFAYAKKEPCFVSTPSP